jgi:hypothetical protein
LDAHELEDAADQLVEELQGPAGWLIAYAQVKLG